MSKKTMIVCKGDLNTKRGGVNSRKKGPALKIMRTKVEPIRNKPDVERGPRPGA